MAEHSLLAFVISPCGGLADVLIFSSASSRDGRPSIRVAIAAAVAANVCQWLLRAAHVCSELGAER